jgi:hypothetical protein
MLSSDKVVEAVEAEIGEGSAVAEVAGVEDPAPRDKLEEPNSLVAL